MDEFGFVADTPALTSKLYQVVVKERKKGILFYTSFNQSSDACAHYFKVCTTLYYYKGALTVGKQPCPSFC